MTIHELKTDPEAFDLLWKGLKTAEVRKFDRDFKSADFLKLLEYDRNTKEYSGNSILCWVSNVYDLKEWAPGFCLLSFQEKHTERRLGSKQ
jgi:hypothetical protein